MLIPLVNVELSSMPSVIIEVEVGVDIVLSSPVVVTVMKEPVERLGELVPRSEGSSVLEASSSLGGSVAVVLASGLVLVVMDFCSSSLLSCLLAARKLSALASCITNTRQSSVHNLVHRGTIVSLDLSIVDIAESRT